MTTFRGRQILRAPLPTTLDVALKQRDNALRLSAIALQQRDDALRHVEWLHDQLRKLQAEVQELKATIASRQQSNDMERVQRMRRIHDALGIARDPTRPLN